MPHPANWLAGWSLLLLAFASGAIIGLGFHRPEFLGGYDSLRRRMVRLGHIAFAALGILNLVFGLAPWPTPGSWAGIGAGWCLALGAFAMPAVCFLTAWREPMRHLFPIPVGLLLLGAGLAAWGSAQAWAA